MNRDVLGDAIRHHYESQSLSADARTRLAAMERAATPRARRWPWATVAAAACAAIIALAVFARDRVAGDGDGERVTVAHEIARDHRSRDALDVTASDYARLAAYMETEGLDFDPVAPEGIPDEDKLLGGCYCSLQGAPAAQLRLVDPRGRPYNVYQTRWRDDYEPLVGKTFVIDGVQVTFWRQNDLLLGLATSADGAGPAPLPPEKIR